MKKTYMIIGVLIGILVILAIVLIATKCNNPETDDPTPTVTSPSTIITTSSTPLLIVTTADADNITISTAELNGSFTGQTALERGFDWDTEKGKFGYSWTETGNLSPGSFNRVITGLNEGTTYFFRSKARNEAGWAYGEEENLQTLSQPEISSITPNIAEQGEITTVNITGSNFTGLTTVSFGDGIDVTNFAVVSDSEIVVDLSVAEKAAGGSRTVTVTTSAGTDTKADYFTIERVMRTVVWSNEDFDWLSHFLTGEVQYQYHIYLREGNGMFVDSVLDFNFGIEVQDGKLCYTNVPATAWDNVYYTSYPHLRYSQADQLMITDSLPLEVLQTLFNPPEDTMPRIETLKTSEGTITITYYSP